MGKGEGEPPRPPQSKHKSLAQPPTHNEDTHTQPHTHHEKKKRRRGAAVVEGGGGGGKEASQLDVTERTRVRERAPHP